MRYLWLIHCLVVWHLVDVQQQQTNKTTEERRETHTRNIKPNRGHRRASGSKMKAQSHSNEEEGEIKSKDLIRYDRNTMFGTEGQLGLERV